MCVCFFFPSFFHTFLIPFWFNSNFTKKKFVRLKFGECDDYVDNMPAGNESTFCIKPCRTRTSEPFKNEITLSILSNGWIIFQTLQICRNEDPFFLNNRKKTYQKLCLRLWIYLWIVCQSHEDGMQKGNENSRLSFQVPLTTEKVLIELIATRFWCINTDTYYLELKWFHCDFLFI